MARSIPIEKAMDDALVVWAQNGEPLRPEQGFPMRLLLPGWEGNTNVKWLRRLELGTRPWMTRWETATYTDPLANGTARQFSFEMDARSIITSPAHPETIERGWRSISGLAWSGRGKIARVDVSTDAGKTWQVATLDEPVRSKAHTRFTHMWEWTGSRDDHPESRDRRNGLRAADARRADARSRRRHGVSLQSDLRMESDAERARVLSRSHVMRASRIVAVASRSSLSRLRRCRGEPTMSRRAIRRVATSSARRRRRAEVAARDVDVGPGRRGPAGGKRHGGARHGDLTRQQCASCHGERGEGKPPLYPRLIGRDSIAEGFPFGKDPRLRENDRQLLAVRDDGVRLRASRDAADDAGLAHQRSGVRGDGVSARRESRHSDDRVARLGVAHRGEDAVRRSIRARRSTRRA